MAEYKSFKRTDVIEEAKNLLEASEIKLKLIPHRLSQQLDTISLQNSALMKKQCRRQQMKPAGVFMYSTGYFCPILSKFELSWHST
jgi:hypothetical protein